MNKSVLPWFNKALLGYTGNAFFLIPTARESYSIDLERMLRMCIVQPYIWAIPLAFACFLDVTN